MNQKMKVALAKTERFLMPLGMAAAVVYLAHVVIGQLLWADYNPVTTDISSLTADGAPNAALLRVFTTVYGVCFLLFAAGAVLRAFRLHRALTRVGFVVFLFMALCSVVGYGLFPLSGDIADGSFQNTMHIVVTIAVVFSTIAAFFLIAFGYLKKERSSPLGLITLVTAILVTVFGAMNPIGMANNLNILGLTERLVIFLIQAYVFFLSLVFTVPNRLAQNTVNK